MVRWRDARLIILLVLLMLGVVMVNMWQIYQVGTFRLSFSEGRIGQLADGISNIEGAEANPVLNLPRNPRSVFTPDGEKLQ